MPKSLRPNHGACHGQSRWQRQALATLLCLGIGIAPLGFLPGVAHAQTLSAETLERIDALLAQARQLFEEERFLDAAAVLEEAFALDPNPRLAFNVARAFERGGDFEQALSYYERATQAPDDTELVTRAEEALARVQVAYAATTPAPGPDLPSGDTPVIDESPTTADDNAALARRIPPPPRFSGQTRQRMRISGYSLLGGGAVLTGVGALFAVQSQNSHDEAVALGRTGIERQRFDDTVASGQTAQTISTLSYAVGFTALATGLGLVITDLVTRPSVDSPSDTAWHVGPGAGACHTVLCLGAGVEF